MRAAAQWAGFGVVVTLLACGTTRRSLSKAPDSNGLELTSSEFPAGGNIPQKFTCEGDDVSPALSWDAPPSGTRSFVLIADDPDAPGGTWIHWVVFDLPAETRQLPENVPKQDQVAGGGRQGRNDFGKIGYGGPCPPPARPHRYFFKLYALDRTLGLPAGATEKQIRRASQGHILARGEYMGRFGR